jgi:hypothetical protein
MCVRDESDHSVVSTSSTPRQPLGNLLIYSSGHVILPSLLQRNGDETAGCLKSGMAWSSQISNELMAV